MSNDPLGDFRAYRSFDLTDVGNASNSLRADSNSVENAILGSVRTATKDFFLAKDGIVAKVLNYAIADYNFARDGGDIGTIVLSGTTIPAGAVVLPGHIIEEVAITSAGSPTIAFGSAKVSDGTTIDADGYKTATAIASIFTNGAGVTVADSHVAETSDIKLTITIATAALTAGKFTVVLPYVVPKSGTTVVTY